MLCVQLLHVLDALGKWALVDTFFMIIMMEAFHLVIKLGTIQLETVVNPKFGLYGYFVATILSLCLCHVASAGQQYALKASYQQSWVSAEPGEALQVSTASYSHSHLPGRLFKVIGLSLGCCF